MADAVTATTALIAVGAAVVMLALVLLVVLVRSRRRGSDSGGQQQMLALVSEMNTRMEVMVRELSEALERAQEEGRRNRFLGELGASIDLDEVLSRTLEAGGAIPGVDAAIISIRDSSEKPIVATLGLSAEEAQRQVVSGPPNGHEARAIPRACCPRSGRKTTNVVVQRGYDARAPARRVSPNYFHRRRRCGSFATSSRCSTPTTSVH